MNIEWKNDTELEIVENIDEENDDLEESFEYFRAGTVCIVDILEDFEDTVNIQFGDGSCAYNVPKNLFNQYD